MATYVLLHGGWGGGFIWHDVAGRLRAADHAVYTPTFTGLGERAHLATPEVGLDTHVQDILNVLSYEEVHDVVLLGYSYSGLVATAVADQVPERLARLVYLDAFVPDDGQSLADIVGPELTALLKDAAQAYDGWRVPPTPPDAPNATPHPLKSFLQPVTVRNAASAALPRTYIACTASPVDWPFTPVFRRIAAKARAAGWRYHEISADHGSVWERVPEALTAVLLACV